MPQVLSILHTFAVMAVVLGFMILIHEFGHYAAAKYFGVRVEQFAIGFGKRLIGFRWGETDYRINILPLGGYVKCPAKIPWMSARAILVNFFRTRAGSALLSPSPGPP